MLRPGWWLRGTQRRGAACGAALALVAAACVVAQVVSPSPASAAPLLPVIATGASHSCQIQSGHASCWGDNSNGELGNNSTINSSVPVPVFTGGVLSGKTLTQITAGITFTCALDSAGVAYCWGLGTSGQLGDSFSVTSAVPVRVSGSLSFTQITSGDAFTCGVTSAGAASCWGAGASGQLGNGLGTASNVPVTVSGGFNLAQVAAGGATACAVATSTSVAYCWGAGASGQLGNGSATASQLTPTAVTMPGGGTTFTQITVGANFACAVATSTSLAYCWGSNASGQLGDNTTTTHNVPTAVYTACGSPCSALNNKTVTQVTAGAAFACALDSTGAAYCWGAGGSGQLGNNNSPASQVTAVAVTIGSPGALPTGTILTQISAGANSACAVASKGAPYCWGANGSGQLGNPSTTAATTFFDVPVAVTSESASIESGYLNGCMIRTGKGYCWGDDSNGELGNNMGTGSYSTPQAVLAQAGVLSGVTLTQIASANSFTCGLSSVGNAYCWGPGSFGQLGDGSTGLSGSNVAVPVTMPTTTGNTTFTQISVGTNFGCALTPLGNAYCWGTNASGQMGHGGSAGGQQNTPMAVTMPGSTTFTQITAGNEYACALTSTGGAYCWGLGLNGQLGQGANASSTSPVAVTMPTNTTFTQISASHWNSTTGFSCAVSSQGAAYCWGLNSSGQLGDNTTTTHNVPTAVYTACGSPCSALNNKTVTQVTAGAAFACALDATGAAYCWGLGTGDQLGNNAASSSSFPVAVNTAGVLLAGGVILTQIGSGQLATCAGDTTGDFYCWGTNGSGQLGNGTITSSAVPVVVMPYPPTSVAAFPGNTKLTVYWAAATPLGSDTVTNYTATASPGDATCTGTLTCAITGLTNGVTYTVTVVTNSSQGPSAPSAAATVTPWPPGTITSGRYHSCTISSGKAYCWGDDSTGELGNGVTTATPTPVAVDTTLTGVGGKTLTQISAGYDFTCALDSAGAAYCWGVNDHGQLGNGAGNVGTNSNLPVAVTGGHTFSQISVGNTHVCALSAGTVWCWGDDTYGQLGSGTTNSGVPISVTTGTVAQVSAGWYHSCALLTTGAAYCWGANSSGQLGITINATDPPVAVSGGLFFGQIGAGQLATCGVAITGAAYCWGDNTNGILGNGGTTQTSVPVAVTMPGSTTFTQISVISSHTACAMDSTGAAWCWGSNSHGQLGNGDLTKTQKTVPVAVVRTGAWTSTTIVQITTGYQQNCAQDAAGTVYCWGINDHGQLGNNSFSESFVTVFVAPQGPTGVAATPGDGTAAISWTAPVFLNNGTITGYSAVATSLSWGGASCSPTPATATSCTISGLLDGIQYTITVTVTATTGTASGNTVTVTPVGFLMLTSPSSLTWGVTGNGVSQSVVDTVSADQQFTATDNTGTGLGWHITVSATTFTNGTHTLPNAGTFYFTGSTSSLVSATPSVTCVAPCTPSTDTTTYPVAITTAPSSPATFIIYDTPAATGIGVMTIGGSTATNPMGWWVQVPGSTYAGMYTTTVSLSIISGPLRQAGPETPRRLAT